MFQLNSVFANARTFTIMAALGASLLLSACGGGGGGDDEMVDDNGNPIQPVTEFTLTSTPDLDGPVFGDNLAVQSRPDLRPGVGDFQFTPGSTQGASRAQTYYSFDLGEIPAGATIRSARLSTFTFSTLGDPQTMMALMRVDHVRYGSVFPLTFTTAQQIQSNFAQIADVNTLGRKDIDATAQVQADIDAGRTRSQYRLRGAVASDFDSINDMALLTDGEDTNGNGELPMLIIEIE